MEQIAIAELELAVDRYLNSVSSCLEQGLDARIATYIKMIPSYPYINSIFIGQEPYKPHLLPKIASAFSWNIANKELDIPPSVSSTAQFICSGETSENKHHVSCVMSIISASYLCIVDGALFLNVHCASTSNQCSRIRMESYFCELILSIIYSTYIVGTKRLRVYTFGDLATSAMDRTNGTLDKGLISGMIITRHKFALAVSLDRKTNDYRKISTVTLDKDIIDYANNFNLTAALPTGDNIINDYIDNVRCIQKNYSAYSNIEMSVLGNPTILFRRFIPWIYNKVVFGTVYLGRLMAGNFNRRPDKADYDSQRLESLRSLATSSQNLVTELEQTGRSLQTIVDSLNPQDKESVQSFIKGLHSHYTLASSVLAYFQSIPAVLSSTESAIQVTGNTIVPTIAVDNSIPVQLDASQPQRRPSEFFAVPIQSVDEDSNNISPSSYQEPDEDDMLDIFVPSMSLSFTSSTTNIKPNVVTESSNSTSLISPGPRRLLRSRTSSKTPVTNPLEHVISDEREAPTRTRNLSRKSSTISITSTYEAKSPIADITQNSTINIIRSRSESVSSSASSTRGRPRK
ncbi:hypothetical protein HDV02_002485 [Globomyces sp. JEL0801]|nr:hypothetical protein HDV02_002485 [Globomyces sp. JEL0801]